MDCESSSSGDSVDKLKPNHIDERIKKLSKLVWDSFYSCNQASVKDKSTSNSNETSESIHSRAKCSYIPDCIRYFS